MQQRIAANAIDPAAQTEIANLGMNDNRRLRLLCHLLPNGLGERCHIRAQLIKF